MVWLSIIGVIATLCYLVLQPDVVAAFWATVGIVFVIYVLLDLFDVSPEGGPKDGNRRRGRGRRREDREWRPTLIANGNLRRTSRR